MFWFFLPKLTFCTLLAAGCPGPPGGLRGSFFRPWGSLSPQNTVKKPKSYLDRKFYVDSLKTGWDGHFPVGIWTKLQVEAEKVGFYHIFKKVAFVEFRVQGPKKILQRLGIFPGVPYHICKMRVKVLYVSDHWEESRIFWPRALFWGPLRPWAFF